LVICHKKSKRLQSVAARRWGKRTSRRDYPQGAICAGVTRTTAVGTVPNPDRRRALELLAGSRYGYTKAILRAHGFSMDMMVELVKAGLATTKRERMVADGRQTGVVRVRITDAGRQALAKMSK